MTDDVLMEVICVNGDRWRRLVAQAVAGRLGQAMTGCDEAFEDDAGPVEDCLLDSVCAFRALRAARGGRGDRREAATEAGESLSRLMQQLATVRREALAAESSAEQ